jgi:hypothetical protein
MKNSVKILLAATAIASAGLFATAPASAQAGFSFRSGDVAIAFSDGYYDHRNRWHRWRDAREHAWYRTNYRNNYRALRRDTDGDGIPNRYDRDRDNDGTPNRYDRRPNNPYRD